MIFVDTSAWIFLFDERQQSKEAKQANTFYRENTKLCVVNDLIIEETHKWLVHHAYKKEKASKILEEFVEQNFAKIIPIENSDRAAACFIVQKYLDKSLSYTEAITAVMMKRTKIKEIFSFDTHFDLFPGITRVF